MSTMNEITSMNVHKVTRFRPGGEEDLEKEITRLKNLKLRDEERRSKLEEEGKEIKEPTVVRWSAGGGRTRKAIRNGGRTDKDNESGKTDRDDEDWEN